MSGATRIRGKGHAQQAVGSIAATAASPGKATWVCSATENSTMPPIQVVSESRPAESWAAVAARGCLELRPERHLQVNRQNNFRAPTREVRRVNRSNAKDEKVEAARATSRASLSFSSVPGGQTRQMSWATRIRREGHTQQTVGSIVPTAASPGKATWECGATRNSTMPPIQAMSESRPAESWAAVAARGCLELRPERRLPVSKQEHFMSPRRELTRGNRSKAKNVKKAEAAKVPAGTPSSGSSFTPHGPVHTGPSSKRWFGQKQGGREVRKQVGDGWK